ncbi:MAG TPA: hypothetical protein VF471_14625 [Pseudoxanthomonas sp.]
MPLDIGFLLADGKLDCRLQLQDDGTYWFLHQWFERVCEATGQYVDLYGGAKFHEANGLSALMDAMTQAKTAAQAQPSEWQVHTGTQLRPVRKELYDKVSRADILKTIERFRALLQEAKLIDQPLVFQGD